jgi:hypothetical protein
MVSTQEHGYGLTVSIRWFNLLYDDTLYAELRTQINAPK